MKPATVILPLTVLSACQMSDANEAQRGMSMNRMAVAHAAFQDMGSDEVAGTLMLSEEIANTCDGIAVHTRVHSYMMGRVERPAFVPDSVKRSQRDAALRSFSARHRLNGMSDGRAVCTAARSEMRDMSFLGSTLMLGGTS